MPILLQQNVAEERLANRVRRETEWLRRGPKARTSKARYRIDEAHRLQEELSQVRGLNRAGGSLALDFAKTGRKTKKLLETRKLAKSYGGEPLFDGLDLVLSPGSRVGFIGRNGCGKSTLMNILGSADSGAPHQRISCPVRSRCPKGWCPDSPSSAGSRAGSHSS